MNIRVFQIAKLLLGKTTTTTYDSIAKELMVSSKTIRNQIHEVELFLAAYQITLHKRAGIGISIAGSESSILAAYQKCVKHVNSQQSYDQNARQIIILHLLLTNKKRVTMQTLEDMLFITRPSIYRDLEAIENRLLQYDIKLKKTRKDGIYLVTGEKRRRQAIYDWALEAHAVNQALLTDDIANYLEYLFSEQTRERKYVKELMDHIQKVCDTNVILDEYERIIVLFLISFHEIRNNRFVSIQQETSSKIKNKKILETLQEQISTVQGKFSIVLTMQEIIYLSAVISSAKTHNYQVTNLESSNPSLIRKVISEFCDELRQYTQPFDEEYMQEELFPYLEKLLQKSNFAFDFYNPLANDMIQNYPRHFELALLLNPIMLKYVDLVLPSREIASIALLLAHLQERTIHQFTAYYFYSQGYFESSYATALINHNIPYIKIIKTLPITSLAQEDLSNVDLLLSNQPLAQKQSIALIIPALPDKDFLIRFRESMQALYEDKKASFFLKKKE